MAPRRRINKGLEPNLYISKGYYKYRHPITKVFKGMGADKKLANAAARQLNAQLMPGQELVQKFYVDRVEGRHEHTISHLISRYQTEYLPTKVIKEVTKEAEIGRLNRIDTDIGKVLVHDFTIKVCADYLDKNFEKNPYAKYRGTIRNLFDFAKRKGIFDKENPAQATESKSRQASEKVRQRMSLEQYKQLHEAACVLL